MTTLLARPYPHRRLAEARVALDAAARGDVAPLHRLYQDAAGALAAIDPDEIQEFLDEHPRALRDDQALAKAAVALADTWEGLVSIGAALRERDRFRGFVWLAAQVRYELEPARRDASRLRAYAQGAALPGTSPEDAALYAALPALVGLGPELPEEVPGPCPVPGEAVADLLGLSADEDWGEIDPLDGIILSPDACRAHYAAAPPAWRELLSRCLEDGLVVRPAAPLAD